MVVSYSIWISKFSGIHGNFFFSFKRRTFLTVLSVTDKTLTLSMLGKKFSRQHFEILLIFSRKQTLTFHANCLLGKKFAWNVEVCFPGKIRKSFKMSSAQPTQRVVIFDINKMVLHFSYLWCKSHCNTIKNVYSVHVGQWRPRSAWSRPFLATYRIIGLQMLLKEYLMIVLGCLFEEWWKGHIVLPLSICLSARPSSPCPR